MAADYTTIRPGIGLGELKFGVFPDEARAYLGEPEPGGDVPKVWLNWDYPELGVSVSFDKGEQTRLLSISIENENATLFGHRPIGLDSESALAIAARCPLGKYKRVDDALGWEAEFDDVSLEFRFDDDRLWLISWQVFIDKRDVIHWPD